MIAKFEVKSGRKYLYYNEGEADYYAVKDGLLVIANKNVNIAIFNKWDWIKTK